MFYCASEFVACHIFFPVIVTSLDDSSIEKYYAQKNWRWEPQPLTISNDSQKHVCASTVNPPKKACLQDIANSDAHSSSCEESDFSGSDADSYDEL